MFSRHFTVIAVLFLAVVWIGGGFYVWRNIPSETEVARGRLSTIQEALKTQKQMVDSALMAETFLAQKETSHDADYRIEKLQQYQQMLKPLDDEW
jgi:hypothetical protein